MKENKKQGEGRGPASFYRDRGIEQTDRPIDRSGRVTKMVLLIVSSTQEPPSFFAFILAGHCASLSFSALSLQEGVTIDK